MESRSRFGEIYILTPGEDVTLDVDYTSLKTTIIVIECKVIITIKRACEKRKFSCVHLYEI